MEGGGGVPLFAEHNKCLAGSAAPALTAGRRPKGALWNCSFQADPACLHGSVTGIHVAACRLRVQCVSASCRDVWIRAQICLGGSQAPL